MLRWASAIGAVNTRDGRITHVITSGGGYLSIPDDKRDEFAKQYATEILHANRSVTLSELPSDPVFPMFFKINHLDRDGLTNEGMQEIYAVVVGVLSRYYADHPPASTLFEAVAFPASSEEVQIDDSRWIKRGFALVFRKLFVTQEQALQLRHGVVCELDGHLGSLACPEYQWSDAVVRGIYTTGIEMYGWGRSVSCTKCAPAGPVSNAEQGALRDLESEYTGLRRKLKPMGTGFDYASLTNIHSAEFNSMKFSQLYLRLTKLRGAKTCTLCSGKGTHMEEIQSPFPTIALDGSGSATDLLTRGEDRLEVIRQTTIRAPATQECTPGFSRPTNHPVCPPAGTADLLRVSGDLRMGRGMTASLFAEAINSDVYADDLRGLLAWKGKDSEVTDPKIVDSIQEFIRVRMGVIDGEKHYGNVRVKSVYSATSFKKAYKKDGEKLVERMKTSNGEVAGPKMKFQLKKLLVRVQGEGSCFCGNRGRHESSSVYFEMGPERCWQRCFCTDDIVGTSQKTCKEYSIGTDGGRRLSGELLDLFTPSSVTGMSRSPPVRPVMKFPQKKPRVSGRNGKRLSKEAQEEADYWDGQASR